MRIGELSERTGVSQRLLRYYEQQGLLAPERTASGYRDYDAADLTTVDRIRRLLAAGLSTATIALVLPCLSKNDTRLVPTCPELVDELRREHDRLTRAIDDLAASRDALHAVITAAAGASTAGA